MGSQSYYRKWRSQTFAEIVGQEHVTRTLQNALQTGRLAHAYLFCGPRGIGKTSAARLLAKTVNCLNNGGVEPCNQCSMCQAINNGQALDIIEIDAASNRGIDEIRDLREKVNFAPTLARYKFYILDEAHMLTNEAFNALLKTLEEPPAHTIFVLVTTEPHKLPATIISRCQRFDFRRISLRGIIGRLSYICQQEGIQVEESALEFIARAATGSLRDAVSLLDQVVAYCGTQGITLDQVRQVLGASRSQAATQLTDYIIERDVRGGLRLINQVADDGADLRQFSREVIEHLRGLMLLEQTGGNPDGLLEVTSEMLMEMQRQAQKVPLELLMQAIKLFNQAELGLRGPAQSQLPLEMAFVETIMWADREMGGPPPHPPMRGTLDRSRSSSSISVTPVRPRGTEAPTAPRQEAPSTIGKQAAETRGVVKAFPSPERTPTPLPAGRDGESPESPAGEFEQVVRNWPNVMESLHTINKSIQALLRACRPIAVENGTLVLGFFYAFHKERIEEPKNKVIVEGVISKVLGVPCRIRCIHTGKSGEQGQSAVDDPVVKAAISLGARVKKIDIVPGESTRAALPEEPPGEVRDVR
ncbi:MAG: DNA polymerase III subunit gamma/tau [Chloroflexi bacterium]|nr:DNA polymerase III subunit gamma/tau [Chloroflexota bacterium]